MIAKLSNRTARIIPLRAQPKNLFNSNQYLVIKVGTDTVLIKHGNITFCQADGNYTKIFTLNKGSYYCCLTLKEVESRLNSPVFFRTHQTYLINTTCIEVITHANTVLLNDNTSVPISRRRRSELLSLFS